MLRHARARRFSGGTAYGRVVAPVAAVAFVVALGALCVGTSRVHSVSLASHTPLGAITSDDLVEHAASQDRITDHGTRNRQRAAQEASVVAARPTTSSTDVAVDCGTLVGPGPGDRAPLAAHPTSIRLRAPPSVVTSTNP